MQRTEHLLPVVLSLLMLTGAHAQEPDAARRDELVHLLRQDCGSCHGLTLAGGLGPPLTATALRDRPAPALEAAILYGRPGTPMPPWRGLLSAAEVSWMVRWLKRGDAR
jgi:cytochrome c55X